MFLISVNLVKKRTAQENKALKKLTVVIPARNEELIIKKSLDNLIKENKEMIKKIIIVVNNSQDNTAEICRGYIKKIPFLRVIEIKDKLSSKVQSISEVIKDLNDEYFVILDADTVLKKDAIRDIYSQIVDSDTEIITGIIEPYPKKGIQYNIISWDRIFRQRILQLGKSFFGMSNFPGCFAIVKTHKYKKLIRDFLMEDYDLTLSLFRERKEIKFVPKIVAYEQEKTNFIKLFFQRIRWTRGNIIIFDQWVKTFRNIPWSKKIIFLTYPIFWYAIYYYLAILLLFSIFTQNPVILTNYLITSLSFYSILLYSKIRFKDLKISDVFTSLGFVLLFPFIILLAFFYAIIGIIFKPKYNMFSKGKYFQR